MAKTPVPKKAAPKQLDKTAGTDAQALKLAAEKQRLASASMLEAQNAVASAVQGIAEIVRGAEDAT